jgi:hypothetical protein
VQGHIDRNLADQAIALRDYPIVLGLPRPLLLGNGRRFGRVRANNAGELGRALTEEGARLDVSKLFQSTLDTLIDSPTPLVLRDFQPCGMGSFPIAVRRKSSVGLIAARTPPTDELFSSASAQFVTDSDANTDGAVESKS